MKYSSFAIALLLNVTLTDGHQLHADPVTTKDAPSKIKPPTQNNAKGVKSTIDYEQEIKDTAKALKADKIKKLRESIKADNLEAPQPLDNNPILKALQDGDALEKKQKKQAEELLKKVDMKSKQVPVLPAKILDIEESKPLAVKEEK
jgi:hypothetical protein